jgi:hypothetical protein
MTSQEQKYAALAPIMSLAAIFAHPIASTALPLILFFIFHWQRMEYARLIALRAADLAFSVQLYLVFATLLLAGYLKFRPLPLSDVQSIVGAITLILIIYLIISLLAGIVQSFRGKAITYYFSMRIGERVFNALQSRQQK